MKTAFKSASNLGLALGLVAGALHAESLWPSTGAGPQPSMFADHKASRRGDILTIVVAESAVASSSQSTSSNRKSTMNDSITDFITSGLGKIRGQMPKTKGDGSAEYSGSGDISNSQSLSARAAVLVTDVLPNGNMVIEGVRMVRFSGETQYVVLHGLVRPDDVARDNSVISTNIADARVEFIAEGALTDAQKRGWLAKVYEKLRPI
jgi:flagellar L-ring protein precursor FlgH